MCRPFPFFGKSARMGFVGKAKEKLSGQRNGSSSSSQNGSPKPGKNDRVIPPEPVQQRPEGVLTDAEAAPALQAHNLARASKNNQKLEWDNRLADEAEAYAKELAERGVLEHSHAENQGENLFMSTGGAHFDDAVNEWLKEEKNYNGENATESNIHEWGHFAQCIWHSTTHVGMGKAKTPDGATYIVARYTPPGNISGGRPY